MQCNSNDTGRMDRALQVVLHVALMQHHHSPPSYLISFSVVGRSARSRPFR